MKVLLVGTGHMSFAYAEVLSALSIDFDVVGRGEENCQKFRENYPNIMCTSGGIENYQFNIDYTHAIVASNVDALYQNTNILIQNNIKAILLEKPGGKTADEIIQLANLAESSSSKIFIAYNRRFYASTLKAKELIELDGGVKSFNFEFTEWAHTIEPLNISSEVKENWFLANSTHVLDTAFFLGGKPKKLTAYYGGENILSWHKWSIFAGAGITEREAFFCYQANWKAPGRWAIEFQTSKHRYIFKPMEILQVQSIGSITISSVEIDDTLDKSFKPGLFLQTSAFLEGDYSDFCSIAEQYEMINLCYSKISGYKLHKTI